MTQVFLGGRYTSSQEPLVLTHRRKTSLVQCIIIPLVLLYYFVPVVSKNDV